MGLEMLPCKIDNILHEVEADHLSSQFDYWADVWAMANTTVHADYDMEIDQDDRVVDTPSAVWLLYSDLKPVDPRLQNPFLIRYSKQMTEKVAAHLGIKIKQYIRIKANILFNDFGQSKDQFCAPHRDWHEGKDAISFVYYVDEVDGSTFTFPEFDKEKRTLGDTVQEFKPDKNSVTVFKADMLHAGQCPTTSNRRYVINVVFEYEELK